MAVETGEVRAAVGGDSSRAVGALENGTARTWAVAGLGERDAKGPKIVKLGVKPGRPELFQILTRGILRICEMFVTSFFDSLSDPWRFLDHYNAPPDEDADEIFAPEIVADSIASSIRLSGTQGGVS